MKPSCSPTCKKKSKGFDESHDPGGRRFEQNGFDIHVRPSRAARMPAESQLSRAAAIAILPEEIAQTRRSPAGMALSVFSSTKIQNAGKPWL